jgi:hypothetical protein
MKEHEKLRAGRPRSQEFYVLFLLTLPLRAIFYACRPRLASGDASIGDRAQGLSPIRLPCVLLGRAVLARAPGREGLMRSNNLLNSFDLYVFQYHDGNRRRRVACALMFAMACLVGLAIWADFFSFGGMKFTTEDWDEKRRALTVMQEGIRQGTVPYFASSYISIWHPTKRLLAMPHLIVSPQVLLLRWMSIGHFFLLDALAFYAIGCVGCALIARRLRLSLFASLLLFLFFNFNGHVVSHLSVGHAEWIGYFLFPFAIYYMLELLTPRPIAIPTLAIGMTHFLMLLQGSFHFMVWDMMFLCLLWAFAPSRRLAWSIAWLVLQVVLLGAVRVWPAAMTFGNSQLNYCPGFPSLKTLLEALVVPHGTQRWMTIFKIGNTVSYWWEYDMYVTDAGLAFLLFFGLLSRLRDKKGVFCPQLDVLHWPMLVFLILSLDHIFYGLAYLPRLPMLGNAERAPARFIVMPVLFLVVLACARFQKYLDLRRGALTTTFRRIAFLGMAYLAFQLVEHVQVWKIRNVEKIPPLPMMANLPPIHLAQLSDPAYVKVLQAGAVTTLVGLVAWVVLAFWLARKEARWAAVQPKTS